MALSIRPKFTLDDIDRMLTAKVDAINEAVINRLRFIGEKFIQNARSVDTYKDRTGNLRSSIGFVILKNGEQIESDFPGLSTEGVETGMALAAKAAGDLPKGLVLIVVAGMGYAGYVESKNFDVLTGSSVLAEADIRIAVEKLRHKISLVS